MVALLSFGSLEQGKAILEGTAPWNKRSLGMNRDMSSSKVMSSLYYSHTYELEYSYCVIILIYELVYSLCHESSTLNFMLKH